MSFAPQPPRSFRMSRTIAALVIREMSTTYGRTALGYLWAILEPVAGLFLLTFVFSLAFRAPPLGTNFPLFYASGLLPFMAYVDVSQKISVSLRFSKALLAFPAVTYADAIIARFLLNSLTHIMVIMIVLTSIILLYRIDVTLDFPAIALAILMALSLGAGVGVLNCFLLSMYPAWERTWAVMTRPLMIISCILFMFDAVPEPYRSWLWYNPLIHITGQMRQGIYQTYDSSYVSATYVFLFALTMLGLGLVLLGRYHRDIINQ